MQPNECQVKWYDQFPQSLLLLACCADANIAQDTIGFCCLHTLVASAQFAIYQVLFNRPAPPQPMSLSPAWIIAACVLFPFQVAALCTCPCWISLCPCQPIPPGEVPLDGSPALGCIHGCPYLVSSANLVRVRSVAFSKIIDIDAKQDRSHYRLLQHSAAHWPAGGV